MNSMQDMWDLWQDPFREREIKKYKQPLPSREFILECLNRYAKPLNAFELAQKFGIEDRLEVLEIRLRSMEREGQIFRNRTGAYALPDKLSLLKGRVDAHKDGYGWLLVEDKNIADVYLSSKQMRRLWHGDIVLAKEVASRHRGKTEAIVVEILERGLTNLVGRLRLDRSKNFAQLSVETKHIVHKVLISATDLNLAKDGDLVEVEILEHPSFQFQASGRVVKIFDEADSMATFLEVTAKNHGIETEFSSQVLAEAAAFGKEVCTKDKLKRFDLTNMDFVTIDGEDAKDFDDAIYCEWLDSGKFKLFVAIADVCAYVQENSKLDLTARDRGNSVYFPNKVIPMLPFALSNNLCSLMPDLERLALVCELEISATGKVENFNFYKALIKSYARLTYTQVGNYLAGDFDYNSDLTQLLQAKPKLAQLMDNMTFLHKNLLNMRYRRNAINFDRQELNIVFNKAGKIDKILKTEKNIAHSLIEEFMLCANVAAASLILEHKLEALFRNHEKPNKDSLEDLQRFLLNLGLKLEGGLEPSAKDYGLILQQSKAREDFEIIQTMLLRSMQQAVYSEENRGHFALAYQGYTHFTSPIRRYSDLLLHRQISKLIEKSASKNLKLKHIKTFSSEGNENLAKDLELTKSNLHNLNKPVALKTKSQQEILADNKKQLHNLGLHLSKKERNADLAARDLIDYLKCLYIKDYLGEVFVSKVVNVTGFGLFVELEDLYIDGLIHISSLPADYYIYDAKFQMLQGRRTKKTFKLGDNLEVQVAGVSLEDRKIDFTLCTPRAIKSFDKNSNLKKTLNKRVGFLSEINVKNKPAANNLKVLKEQASKAIPRRRANTKIVTNASDKSKVGISKNTVKIQTKSSTLNLDEIKDMLEPIQEAEFKNLKKEELHEKAINKAVEKKNAKKAAQKAEKKREKKKLKQKIKKQQQNLKKKQKRAKAVENKIKD